MVVETYASLISDIRPDAQEITELGPGDINEVILVDDAEVFRFPKNDEGREALRYETELLKRLAGMLPLDVPVPIELADDASYGIFSYVPGKVLKNKDIDSFTDEQKISLGHTLAAFMVAVNSSMPPEEAAHLRATYYPHFPTEVKYHEHALALGTETKNPYLPLYRQYYQELLDLCGGSLPEQNMLIHGDLHSGNLIFASDNTLRGVIDFSDFGFETVYSDLRQMYRMGDMVVSIIITDLTDKFGPIDIEIVRAWAITHEFSVLMRPGALTGENNRATVARNLLEVWLGQNWGEL